MLIWEIWMNKSGCCYCYYCWQVATSNLQPKPLTQVLSNGENILGFEMEWLGADRRKMRNHWDKVAEIRSEGRWWCCCCCWCCSCNCYRCCYCYCYASASRDPSNPHRICKFWIIHTCVWLDEEQQQQQNQKQQQQQQQLHCYLLNM